MATMPMPFYVPDKYLIIDQQILSYCGLWFNFGSEKASSIDWYTQQYTIIRFFLHQNKYLLVKD